MNWLNYIETALINLGGVSTYSQLYDEIELIRSNDELSTNWKATVRGVIERHSSDSEAYLGKKDIFYSVDGLGQGIWGLRNYVDNQNNDNSGSETSRQNTSVNRIIRDTKIIKELKAFHSDTCQLCSLKIKVGENRYYSEGHHIKPLGKPHNGKDVKENVIILCPNCHIKFDYGMIDIDNYNLNKDKFHKVNTEFIDYYKNNILRHN